MNKNLLKIKYENIITIYYLISIIIDIIIKIYVLNYNNIDITFYVLMFPIITFTTIKIKELRKEILKNQK